MHNPLRAESASPVELDYLSVFRHQKVAVDPKITLLSLRDLQWSGPAARLSLCAQRMLLTSDSATAVDALNEPDPTLF